MASSPARHDDDEGTYSQPRRLPQLHLCWRSLELRPPFKATVRGRLGSFTSVSPALAVMPGWTDIRGTATPFCVAARDQTWADLG
ncbi:hypothetical protein SKAU_G00010670 [Synaphobranchus kaupii]|uniref:Uncharacterized protein n=1 Tax=Synaphobranchus kaupii TaxID=118154 RepID=A0A9Q1GB43_SYNKA|nr:hypothetical protein SKAU_G00010670 [Synaphobranchus kaupii]